MEAAPPFGDPVSVYLRSTSSSVVRKGYPIGIGVPCGFAVPVTRTQSVVFIDAEFLGRGSFGFAVRCMSENVVYKFFFPRLGSDSFDDAGNGEDHDLHGLRETVFSEREIPYAIQVSPQMMREMVGERTLRDVDPRFEFHAGSSSPSWKWTDRGFAIPIKMRLVETRSLSEIGISKLYDLGQKMYFTNDTDEDECLFGLKLEYFNGVSVERVRVSKLGSFLNHFVNVSIRSLHRMDSVAVHRDLHGKNILVGDNSIKFIDCGLVRPFWEAVRNSVMDVRPYKDVTRPIDAMLLSHYGANPRISLWSSISNVEYTARILSDQLNPENFMWKTSSSTTGRIRSTQLAQCYGSYAGKRESIQSRYFHFASKEGIAEILADVRDMLVSCGVDLDKEETAEKAMEMFSYMYFVRFDLCSMMSNLYNFEIFSCRSSTNERWLVDLMSKLRRLMRLCFHPLPSFRPTPWIMFEAVRTLLRDQISVEALDFEPLMSSMRSLPPHLLTYRIEQERIAEACVNFVLSANIDPFAITWKHIEDFFLQREKMESSKGFKKMSYQRIHCDRCCSKEDYRPRRQKIVNHMSVPFKSNLIEIPRSASSSRSLELIGFGSNFVLVHEIGTDELPNPRLLGSIDVRTGKFDASEGRAFLMNASNVFHAACFDFETQTVFILDSRLERPLDFRSRECARLRIDFPMEQGRHQISYFEHMGVMSIFDASENFLTVYNLSHRTAVRSQAWLSFHHIGTLFPWSRDCLQKEEAVFFAIKFSETRVEVFDLVCFKVRTEGRGGEEGVRESLEMEVIADDIWSEVEIRSAHSTKFFCFVFSKALAADKNEIDVLVVDRATLRVHCRTTVFGSRCNSIAFYGSNTILIQHDNFVIEVMCAKTKKMKTVFIDTPSPRVAVIGLGARGVCVAGVERRTIVEEKSFPVKMIDHELLSLYSTLLRPHKLKRFFRTRKKISRQGVKRLLLQRIDSRRTKQGVDVR